MSSTPAKNYRPPILVTGAHRTGTTWVGKMLAASGQVAYISEPLNVLHRLGVLCVPVQFWYTYINAENESAYLPALRQTIDFRYHALAEIRSLRSVKDALRMARDWSIFTKGRLFRQRALLKDPFAAFSAPWFARKLGCQVVVTVRHPAAFASSLKWLKWDFDFNDLLAQPLLMQDWLEPFRYDIEKSLHEGAGIIVRASLLWRIVYRVMMDYQREFPDFRVVRHEDLSLDPIQGFGALYESLGLSFSDRARKVILESSSADNPKQLAKGKVHQVRLDSRANLDNWKRRLEKEEIRRIRQITEGVAEIYYPDQSWD